MSEVSQCGILRSGLSGRFCGRMGVRGVSQSVGCEEEAAAEFIENRKRAWRNSSRRRRRS